MILVDAALLLISAGVAVPTGVVSSECLLEALTEPRPPKAPSAHVPRVAVLVPAHNEESGIGPTLSALKRELGPTDRLIVVADNCTDRTAELSRAAGAEVLERFDTTKRGKGYALTFGFDALKADPPDVVVIVDADCQLTPGSIQQLVQVAASGSPAQAEYTMTLPPGADLRARVSVFAFRVRNKVRPRAMARLGLPCHLAGSGMAFPWAALRDGMPLGDDLAEDLLLGVKLALKGHLPSFLPGARVESELAASGSGHTTQRQRWEQGHLATLRRTLPRLFGAAIARRDLRLFGLALDVGVPPLTLHMLSLSAVFAASAVSASLGGSVIPLLVVGAQGGLLTLALGTAWFRHGRDVLPKRMLARIPLYVAWKVPLYLHMAFMGGARTWVRAERAGASTETPGANGGSP